MGASDKPLAGKTIVVTRAPDQARELVRELEHAGAEVLLLPTVGTEAPKDWCPLDNALSNLESFDVIVFVSATAVEATFKLATMLRKDEAMRESSGRLIAAVGPATARAATRHGMRVDHVASDPTGESLVRELRGSLAGRNVLLPRGDRGDRRLVEALLEAGAEVTEVVAYRTVAPEPLDPVLVRRIRSADVDVVIFASPSAFHNLCDTIDAAELAKLSKLIRFAAIGPTTARAIREAGSCVDIVAKEPSAEGLADAIVKYYEGRAAERDASGSSAAK